MLWLIRGLPGVGKSFLARFYFRGLLHLEQDMFMMQKGIYKFDHSKLSENHLMCQRMTEGCLALGADCVVSNTFTQSWELAPYLELAEKYSHQFHIIHKKATKDESSTHDIPSEAIKKMTDRWEKIPGETVIARHSTMTHHIRIVLKKYCPEKLELMKGRNQL